MGVPDSELLERLGLPGGQSSPDDQLVRKLFERTGAYVMGRRMFDEGEAGWPENPPFRAPVFVLTHSAREPWQRKGGTTFFFVIDGIASALQQAKAASSGKDVRVSGGAETIRQYLEAGMVDELALHIAPLLLGTGLRLLGELGPADLDLQQLGSRTRRSSPTSSTGLPDRAGAGMKPDHEDDAISRAISSRRLLHFVYNGCDRTVEPHTYGVDSSGQRALVAFQVAGNSRSGESLGWKTFHQSRMRDVAALEQQFSVPRPEYHRDDGAFAMIFTQL